MSVDTTFPEVPVSTCQSKRVPKDCCIKTGVWTQPDSKWRIGFHIVRVTTAAETTEAVMGSAENEDRGTLNGS